MFEIEKINKNLKEEYCYINSNLLFYLQSLEPHVYQKLLNSISKKNGNQDTIKDFYLPLTTGQQYESFYKREPPQEFESSTITRYRLVENLRNFISGKDKYKKSSLINLLKIIIEEYNITNDLLLFHPKSVLFPKFINNFELGCMQSFYERRPGKKSDYEKSMQDKLPHRTVIYPTLMNDKNLYLKIPTDLVNAFNIQKKDIYQMGIDGDKTDTLFFFPKKNNDKTNNSKKETESIETIKTNLITDENSIDYFGILNNYFEKINLWYSEIKLSCRNNSVYLRVPKPFLDNIGNEFILQDEQDFESPFPAFVLSYDPLGNLMYSRILFTKQSNHENCPFGAILASNLPEEIKSYETLDLSKLSQDFFIDLDEDCLNLLQKNK